MTSKLTEDMRKRFRPMGDLQPTPRTPAVRRQLAQAWKIVTCGVKDRRQTGIGQEPTACARLHKLGELARRDWRRARRSSTGQACGTLVEVARHRHRMPVLTTYAPDAAGPLTRNDATVDRPGLAQAASARQTPPAAPCLASVRVHSAVHRLT